MNNPTGTRLAAVVLLSVFGACTTMEQYYPNASKTLVDGEEFIVRELSPGTYQAFRNHPDLGYLVAYDARIWGRNVKAIEQVTGCKVMPGSTRNTADNTVAAVDC